MQFCQLFWTLLATLVLSCTGETKDFSVVAYLPEWRYEGANWDEMTKYVSHLVLFSLEMSGKGEIIAKDRLPRPELLAEARAAADKNGAYLMICFGGNGRSDGFSMASRKTKYRERFVQEVYDLLEEYQLDGVDYNWEYPGFLFASGYKSKIEVDRDYEGLSALLHATRLKLGEKKQITMAYYPDGRQESYIISKKMPEHVDLFHMMTYDANGDNHSPYELAEKSVERVVKMLPKYKHQFTVGLPFYGRKAGTGAWVTYEDLVQEFAPLGHDVDKVKLKSGEDCAFNGVNSIRAKVKLAIDQGLGGVMIWEVGQDCRIKEVQHADGSSHVRTCPSLEDSLLYNIGLEIESSSDHKRTERIDLKEL